MTYMSGKQSGPVFDPLTHSTQWSRRFNGLKLFLALANLGESGYAAMIEHQAPGQCPAPGADGLGLAVGQRNATAAGLLYARASQPGCLSRRGVSPAADRLDVRGLHQRGSGAAGLHHQLPHYGSQYPPDRGRDESTVSAGGRGAGPTPIRNRRCDEDEEAADRTTQGQPP